jgi:hypothetical protein
MMRGATPDTSTVRTGLDRIAALCTLFVALGPLTVRRIAQPGVLNPGTGVNTFFEQYRRHEPVFLVVMALFAVGLAVAARRAVPDESNPSPLLDVGAWGAGRLLLVAAITFAVCVAGTSLIMHALPLSMDEYVAQFQSRVFASGRLAAPLEEPWRQFAWSLKPVFIAYEPERHLWVMQYLPMYAALRALFVGLGADRLLNPALAAASLPLAYACARRLWPDDETRAWVAVALLALSTQALFMSMTSFAMPAHLAVNLLWLYAFLRNDRVGWIAAPLIGALALGLHNPFPHALFVTPFLFFVLWQRRWGWTAYFAGVYLAGIVGWYWWGKSVQLAAGAGASLFQTPGLLMLAVQELSLTVMLSWQTPILAVALLVTALSWRSLSTIERLLGAGILASFGFYFLFPSTQGHGWGYRYTYPVLGSMALLGAVGVDTLRRSLGGVFVRRALIASALVTLGVQIPVRGWQVERYVRPFALAHDYVAHIDADVVIVDPTTSWYGIDLIRNDPFLRNRPKVLSAFGLRREQKQELAAMAGNRVHLLRPDEIGQFGIPIYPSRFRGPVWPPADSVAPGATIPVGRSDAVVPASSRGGR